MRSDSIKDIEKTANFVDASGSNGGHLCTCTKMDDWRSSNCQVVQTSNLLKGTICFFLSSHTCLHHGTSSHNTYLILTTMKVSQEETNLQMLQLFLFAKHVKCWFVRSVLILPRTSTSTVALSLLIDMCTFSVYVPPLVCR